MDQKHPGPRVQIPCSRKTVAVLDVALTGAVAYLIAKQMQWDVNKTIIGAFVLGVVTHKVLGIRTPLNDIIFKS